jgi:TonB-dependent starch-binding outer membrane protein SusC
MRQHYYYFNLLRTNASKLLLLFLFNAVTLSSVFAGTYARTITGTINDVDNGQPLIGATVRVKESPKGAITDARGRFSINIDDSDKTLVISYTGYETVEVAIGSNSTFTVTMSPSASSLDQIVVVGYGTQKKSSLTGAISQVTSREMSALPVADVRQALQGRAPGVSVVNNGAPGEDPIVRIRGIGSINFAANPLYVVDGLPVGDLATIDTRDVESVEVLKDAAAAAIYGSRASNGVIMITTKKGSRDGTVNVSLESYYGSQTAWRQLDLLNRDEYIKYATALRTNAGQALPARFGRLNEPVHAGATQTYGQTDTDWQDEMFQTAGINQTNLSVSTGNEKSRLFVGLGYLNQDGIMLGTKYQRYNMRINYDYKIGKRVTIGQNISLGSDYRLNENNGGGRTQLKHILHMTPYIPVEDLTLPGGYRGPSGDDGSDPQNPVRLAKQDLNRNNRFRLISTAFVDVELFKGLNYRFTAGADYTSFVNRINNPIYNESFNARALNRVEQNRFTGMSPYFSSQLTFDKTFGKHNVNITAVSERQDGNFSSLSGGGQYPTNELTQISNTLTDASINGRTEKSILYSYVGRLNYEFGGKYLLSGSFRRDGSSVFAPGKKWGNFSSVSAGWRLSEENFLKNNKYISELKLRGSYGTMGFNGIANYAWQPVLSQNTAAVFGADARVQGSFFDQLGNTDLAWEITQMSNVGLDLGLFDNRLTFSAEYYSRLTDGLILNQPISPSLGFTQPTPANVGSMRNTGWEFQAGYRKVKGDFRWNVNANLGWVRNNVESFGADIKTPLFDGANADYGGDPLTITRPGSPVQTFFGWQVDGIFQNQSEIDRLNAADGNDKTPYQSSATKPGDIRFKDVDGNGVVDVDDRVELGSFLPDFTYGANLDLNYKNFDFTIFLQGVQGNTIYNGTKVLRQGMLRLFNAGTEVLNAWTPTNTNTDVPRAVDGDPNRNSRTSDRFLEDGSYLRIKNLTIGYTLPASALNNITKGGVSRLRIYVSSQNLLTLTKYTGYDPEIGSRFNGTLTNGVDYGQFPAARTILGGIQVGF